MFTKHFSMLLLGYALVGTTATRTLAQDRPIVLPSPSPTALKNPIRVGTNEIEPFVFLTSDLPYGYEIDLWNEVASDLNFETEWVPYESFSQMMADLSAGKLDAAIAGISITAEREAGGFDFSYPSYRSGLQLMVRWQGHSYGVSPDANPIRAFINGFFHRKIWQPLLLVLATSAGVGTLIWLSERHHNEHFSNNPVKGIGRVFGLPLSRWAPLATAMSRRRA